MIFFKNFYINAAGSGSKTSLIHDINAVIRESKIPSGLLTVYAPLGRAGVTVASKKEIDSEPLYLSRTLSIPFDKGALNLDPWQEIFLVDHDTSSRRREVCVHIIGDGAESPAGAQGPRQGKPLAKIPIQKKMVKA